MLYNFSGPRGKAAAETRTESLLIQLARGADLPYGADDFISGKTRMKYALFYILSIVAVNCAFDLVPPLVLPGGDVWSPVALVVGFVFVIRDYAQREIGHYVLPAMLFGGFLSWLLASPNVALASLCAFFAGELLDWAVYTFTGRPFSQRVLFSSALSTPVDSAVFLAMVGMFSWSSVLIMTVSKMVGAFAVFLIARRRESIPA